LRSNNELRYHWNDNGYNFGSNLILPDNQWSHVAMVVTPTGVTLYLNGKAAVNNYTVAVEAFDAPFKLGHDNGSRYFKGNIDEVCIYNRALSQAEIREQMHLTKTSTSQNGLVSYYQMNESRGLVLDRIGTLHMGFAGNTARVLSTGPFGPGQSYRKNINSGKRHAFDPTGMVLTFPQGATLPNGEVVVTRLRCRPDTLLSTQKGLYQYWILENYGQNASFTAPSQVLFQHYGALPADLSAGKLKLWRRGALADGLPWTLLDSAKYVTAGNDASITFNTISQLKNSMQLFLSAPANFTISKPLNMVFAPKLELPRSVLYPNPVPLDGILTVQCVWLGLAKFRLYDAKGNLMVIQTFEGNLQVDRSNFKGGVYFYRIENETNMETGTVIFE
jgi:hypothetical protein